MEGSDSTPSRRDLAGAEPPDGPAALIVAHPGHEIRVHAWMCQVRPRVFVLTDGSGHGETGRVGSSERVLSEAGASRGSCFGRWTDRDAYDLILDGRTDALLEVVEELAEGLVDQQVRYVLSDAVEGLNPVHDLCFVLTLAALRRASSRLDRTIGHFHFLLDADPGARLQASPDARVLPLSDAELRRKIDAARGYPELRREVDHALGTWGEDAFRREVMYPAPADVEAFFESLPEAVGAVPGYESFGARRVAEGVYPRLLRFREHFEPLARALLEPATARAGAGS